MKLPSIFKNKEIITRQWPSCKQPKTVSFREGEDIFKTVNSVYFDPLALETVETPESWFTNSSSESASFSTESHIEEYCGARDQESLEMIVRRVRSSERLFFEPGSSDTNSILEGGAKISSTCTASGANNNNNFPLKESIVLAMESEDPYFDFKSSMQEMVETHGLKDWESLEELLGWYLKMNGKMNHGFIVGAFVDLLLQLAAASNNSSDHDSSSYSFLSASSSFSTPSNSPLSPIDQKEIIEAEEAS